MLTSKSILIISFLLVSYIALSVQLVPLAVLQNGFETDTIIVQELFTVKDFQIGIGFNLKRFGVDIGYVTPWLFRGILIHFGVFHKWEDLNRQFAPAFGIGISIKF
jgi:hypothetical protein